MGRRIAAGFLTAALSTGGGLLFLYGPLVWTIPLMLGAMGLVAVATVVGTLWSGEAIGLLLGVAPLSVIVLIAIVQEADPQGGIAWIIITFLALCVSAASWGFTLAATRNRRRGWTDPTPHSHG